MRHGNVITGYVFDDGSNGTTPYHCVNCGQMLMAVRGHLLTWSSGSGIPYNTIAIGTSYLEHICARCKVRHQVLIQSVLGVTIP